MEIRHEKVISVEDQGQRRHVKVIYREFPEADPVNLYVEVSKGAYDQEARLDANKTHRAGGPLASLIGSGTTDASAIENLLSKLDQHLAHYSDHPKPLLTNP